MTEALQKMVEAMICEAKRQDDESARQLEEVPWLKDEPVSTEHAYNWHSIARAGLEAIRYVPEEMLAGRPNGWSHIATAHGVSMMFDALLNDATK